MIAIVVSRADSASEHIGQHLLDLTEWTERADDGRSDGDGGGTYYRTDDFELRTFDDLHLDLERPADAFSSAPEFLVFVSRHSGDTGPLLTAHFTGNFGPAEYGGEAGRFAEACPNAQSLVVDALSTAAPDGYEVGIECTHHGPTDVGAPSMFVELGSDEEQWADAEAAKAVARVVLSLSDAEPHRDRQVVGLGGGHYAPRFGRIVRETDWAVGHVAADWCLNAMGSPEANEDVLDRAFAASNADRVVLDMDDGELVETVEALGYRVVSETYLRETDSVSLTLADAVEASLTTVDDGLRFGERSASADDVEFVTVSLPAELVAAARGVDTEATFRAARSHLLAFETAEGGTVPRGDAAVRESAEYEAFVTALTELLSEKYETVRRENGEVVARTTRFDPAKARVRGVTEGPAFGRLASGEAVEVDGKTIRPTDVETETVERFSV